MGKKEKKNKKAKTWKKEKWSHFGWKLVCDSREKESWKWIILGISNIFPLVSLCLVRVARSIAIVLSLPLSLLSWIPLDFCCYKAVKLSCKQHAYEIYISRSKDKFSRTEKCITKEMFWKKSQELYRLRSLKLNHLLLNILSYTYACTYTSSTSTHRSLIQLNTTHFL